jgi:hypothetical protein
MLRFWWDDLPQLLGVMPQEDATVESQQQNQISRSSDRQESSVSHDDVIVSLQEKSFALVLLLKQSPLFYVVIAGLREFVHALVN